MELKLGVSLMKSFLLEKKQLMRFFKRIILPVTYISLTYSLIFNHTDGEI